MRQGSAGILLLSCLVDGLVVVLVAVVCFLSSNLKINPSFFSSLLDLLEARS